MIKHRTNEIKMKIIWQFSTENSDKVYFSHITIKLTAHNYNVGKMGACSFLNIVIIIIINKKDY